MDLHKFDDTDNEYKKVILKHIQKNKTEIWRPIIGFSRYAVSSCGRIKNIHSNKCLKTYMNINQGYKAVKVTSCNGKRKAFLVHRLLAMAFVPNILNKPFVDHIDRDRTNNLVTNLRWATASDNQANRPKKSGCSSQHKGVFWDKGNKKWCAQIKYNYQLYHLGNYKDEDDAGEAFNVVAKLLHNEFAYLNRVKEGRKRRNQRYYAKNKERLKATANKILSS